MIIESGFGFKLSSLFAISFLGDPMVCLELFRGRSVHVWRMYQLKRIIHGNNRRFSSLFLV